jgi:uncharacterized protein
LSSLLPDSESYNPVFYRIDKPVREPYFSYDAMIPISIKKHLSRENIILFSSLVLIPVYMLFGMSSSFDYFFSTFRGPSAIPLSFARVFYENIFHFLAFFIVPLLIVRLVLRESTADFGLRAGDTRFGFTTVFLLFLPAALFMVLTVVTDGVRLPTFHSFYPQIPAVQGSPCLFFINILFMALYYMGFEFFYRGYLLFGLKDKFGAVAALLIQAIPSTLIHFNKPGGELLASIAGELLLGMLALRTGSIVYGLLLHFLVGVSIELSSMLF